MTPADLQANPNRFLTSAEEARVVAAIAAAEARTTGEIRVHLERDCPGDPLDRAHALLVSLGMTATAGRSGVLLYVATGARRFAVAGDQGVDAAVGGDEFWAGVRDRLAERFREGRYADGLCEAIGGIGARLAETMPGSGDNRNELPDTLSYDG